MQHSRPMCPTPNATTNSLHNRKHLLSHGTHVLGPPPPRLVLGRVLVRRHGPPRRGPVLRGAAHAHPAVRASCTVVPQLGRHAPPPRGRRLQRGRVEHAVGDRRPDRQPVVARHPRRRARQGRVGAGAGGVRRDEGREVLSLVVGGERLMARVR